MTTPTAEQRALWQRLAAEATPGPWEADTFTVYPSQGVVQARCDEGCDGGCDDEGEIEVARVCAQHEHSREVIADVYGLGEFAAKDGAFLAAARDDVPALLAALDRTEEHAAQAVLDCEKDAEIIRALRSERDALALRVRDLAAKALAFARGAEVRSWPPGHKMRSDLIALCRITLDEQARAALASPATPGATTEDRSNE